MFKDYTGAGMIINRFKDAFGEAQYDDKFSKSIKVGYGYADYRNDLNECFGIIKERMEVEGEQKLSPFEIADALLALAETRKKLFLKA